MLMEASNEKLTNFTLYYPYSFIPMLRINTVVKSVDENLSKKIRKEYGVKLNDVQIAEVMGFDEVIHESQLWGRRFSKVKEINFNRHAEHGAEVFPDCDTPSDDVYLFHVDNMGAPLALLNAKVLKLGHLL